MLKIYEKVTKITQQQLDSKYPYVQFVDSGSYGIVNKHKDVNTGQFVAIKFLKSDQGVQTFDNQEGIMKQIDHQNVLKSLGFFYNSTKRQYILITPYCENGNLKDKLSQITTTYNQKQKLFLCVQIARGVNALHEKNIMHRDIKPANILIDKNWILKLCDFGFGKADDDLSQSVKVGTPLYRDPNIACGKYSKKCDIYSVGLVLDTIFRGSSCYKNVSENMFPAELLYFKNNKSKIIGELKCNQKLKNIILGCLQQSQFKRYDSKILVNKLQDLWYELNPQIVDSRHINNGNSNKNTVQSNLLESVIDRQKIQINQRKFNNQITKFNEIVENSQYVIKNDPKIKKMRTQYQSMYQPSNNLVINKNVNISQLKMPKLTPKKYISGSSSPKKGSYSQNSQTNNFLSLLLKSEQILSNNIEKNQNFQTVYLHFVKNRQEIRKLNLIQQLKSVPSNDKKIIAFIGLFSYLKFLALRKNYLNKKSPPSKSQFSIQGVKIENISEITIQKCLDLVQADLVQTLNAIKPFLVDLNADRVLYKQKLTQSVHAMINQGAEKKFTTLTNSGVGYDEKDLQREFHQIVMNKRYQCLDRSEKQLKETLISIVNNLFVGKSV